MVSEVKKLSKVGCIQTPVTLEGSHGANFPRLSKDEAVYRFHPHQRSCGKNMPMIAIMALGPATAEVAHGSGARDGRGGSSVASFFVFASGGWTTPTGRGRFAGCEDLEAKVDSSSAILSRYLRVSFKWASKAM